MAKSKIEILAYEIAESDFSRTRSTQLAEKYKMLWDELVSQNIPREQIAKRGHEIIKQQLKKVYRDKGLDPNTAKFNNDSWYYELAAKNKFTPESATDNPNSSDDFETKLNEDSECYDERYNNILLYRQLKKFLTMCIEQTEKDFDEVKEEKTGKIEKVKRDWKSFYEQSGRKEFFDFIQNFVGSNMDEWSRCLDARQALLPKLKFVAAAIVSRSGATISDFCTNYFALVKNKTQISPKAYRKFITEVKAYSDFMQFIQEDAWKWNVLLIRCPKCQIYALKTRIYPNGTWDFVCTNKKAHKDDEQPHFSPNLFRKYLQIIYTNRGGVTKKLLDEIQIHIKTNDPVVAK